MCCNPPMKIPAVLGAVSPFHGGACRRRHPPLLGRHTFTPRTPWMPTPRATTLRILTLHSAMRACRCCTQSPDRRSALNVHWISVVADHAEMLRLQISLITTILMSWPRKGRRLAAVEKETSARCW